MPSSKSTKSRSTTPLYIIIGVLLFAVGILVTKNFFKSDPIPEAVAFKLPTNAVKTSECLPHMGEHWVEPDKLPNGPIYVLNQGKLISVEYMFTPEELPGEDFAKLPPSQYESYMKTNNLTWSDIFLKNKFAVDLPDVGMDYKSFEIAWSPPHAGLIIPHYDVHVAYVSKDEVNAVCPDARIEDSLAPALIENIRKNNIPVPGF